MPGLVVFVLLLICTCAYVWQVPRLRQLFFSEKKGLWGALYKGCCFLFFVLFFFLNTDWRLPLQRQ